MTGCLIILIAVLGSIIAGATIGDEAGWAVFGLSMLIIAVIVMLNAGGRENWEDSL